MWELLLERTVVLQFELHIPEHHQLMMDVREQYHLHRQHHVIIPSIVCGMLQ